MLLILILKLDDNDILYTFYMSQFKPIIHSDKNDLSVGTLN